MNNYILLLIPILFSAATSCKSTSGPNGRSLRNGLTLKDCGKTNQENCEQPEPSKDANIPSKDTPTDPTQDSLEVPEDQFTKTDQNDPAQIPAKGEGKPNPMPSPPPVDLSVPQVIPNPLPITLKCSAQTIHYVSGSGRCNQNAAAFAADDNKSMVFACCPLPTTDILMPGEPVARSGQCADQEVIVGATGSSLLCARINTLAYALSPPVATCYLGYGASGGAGAKKCGTPLEIEKALVSTFGSDACLPTPYGGLVTKRSSKYCRDVSGSTLLYKSTRLPVPMFQ